MVAPSLLQAVLAAPFVAFNLTELFGANLSAGAEIIPFGNESFYDKLQQRWTNYNAPSYELGAIKPATEKDVQTIVKIAAKHKIPFFTTGGGHGISDYHKVNGLSIQLSKFDGVEIDNITGTLTVGGAVKIHQLVQPLAQAGRELPLGSCACVGVIGATLGGGIGSLHGHQGLMVDHLKSVRIVTADGELRTASQDENADLFWALRGAGSNFGIVTSATFDVPKVSNHGMYMNADFVYPASSNGSFWEVMQKYDGDLPSRMAITAVSFYNRVTDEPVIAVNVIYFGAREDGEPHVRAFQDLGPVMSNISMIPSHEVMDAAFFSFFGQDNGACTPNQHINIYTVALKQFHPPTFQAFFANLTRFWADHPDYQGRLLMQRYASDGPMQMPDDSTAFALRDVKTLLNIEGFHLDSSLDSKVNEFQSNGRAAFIETSGYDELAVYNNYARGDEGPAAWYSTRKLTKLSALKLKWDPEQRFSFNLPIPLLKP